MQFLKSEIRDSSNLPSSWALCGYDYPQLYSCNSSVYVHLWWRSVPRNVRVGLTFSRILTRMVNMTRFRVNSVKQMWIEEIVRLALLSMEFMDQIHFMFRLVESRWFRRPLLLNNLDFIACRSYDYKLSQVLIATTCGLGQVHHHAATLTIHRPDSRCNYVRLDM